MVFGHVVNDREPGLFGVSNRPACCTTRGWDSQKVIPMSRSNQPNEKASTVEHAGELISKRFLRILGLDDQKRQHCYKPATGEIIVREKTGLTSEVHERIDIGGKTIEDYRVFVETEVESIEMNWYEEAFNR